MLILTVPGGEFWDHKHMTFSQTKEVTLQLEHSLISLSEWEAKWKKPFLSIKSGLTPDEFIDYVRCMTVTKNVDPEVYTRINQELADKIIAYIDDSMTATWFAEDSVSGAKPRHRETITAEVIYYQMIALNIPFECRKWHLNKLLTLIRVCSIKSQPEKKMSKAEIMKRNRALNAKRKARLGTHG